MIHLNRNLTEISILGSATQSPLIMDFLLICLCLDFGIFCHVGLFPLNLRLELLSKDTSANWYPLDIVSAFLLHPRSSELWLLLTFPHHIDSLPWFSLPNFSARLVSDLSLPDCQIPSLIHSYFSLSRPVIRSLGRHFPPTYFVPFPFSLNFAARRFCPYYVWFWKLSLPCSLDQTGDVGWENTDGAKGYPCFCFRGLDLAAFSTLELQFQGKVLFSPKVEQTWRAGSLEGMAEIA